MYERQFLELMQARRVEDSVDPEILNGGCLLCSEETPDRCQRRLVTEYLCEKWGGFPIEHLI